MLLSGICFESGYLITSLILLTDNSRMLFADLHGILIGIIHVPTGNRGRPLSFFESLVFSRSVSDRGIKVWNSRIL
jgi:hypothetical protein